MATIPYKQLLNPSDNLIALIKEQNASGAEFGELKGSEPFEVLVSKALFNAANTGGSLGEVTSVNGLTGTVVLTKTNIDLGNVPNTDATNASNLASGTVPDARFPATLPAASGVLLTALNASSLASGTTAVARGGTGQTSYTDGQLLIGNASTGSLTKATLTAGSNVTITNGNGTITIAATGGGGGGGDITGPVSSTNTALAKWNGTGGDALSDSGVLVDASNNITGVNDLTADVVSAPEIAISATHATDDTYHGITITGLNSGASITMWDAVYLGGSSTWLVADANGSGTYPARGLAVGNYSNTNPAVILIQGTVRNDAWGWTPGGTIYLSGTAGALTQTAPSGSGDKVQQVGFALTADVAWLNFASGEYATVT